MNVVILQPSYIPWRGYFHQIRKADIFVFYDCVQYDKEGWRNRNKIKTKQGLQWLTIPVHSKGATVASTPIRDVPINWATCWNKKHFNSFKANYARCPYFKEYAPLLEEMYSRRDEKLADFTCDYTIRLARELGVQETQFIKSSSMDVEGSKTDRLLSILTKLGATNYISGPSARSYIEECKLNEAGIKIEYMSYNYRDYPQQGGDFCSTVTVLDLLLNVGPRAFEYIWGSEE